VRDTDDKRSDGLDGMMTNGDMEVGSRDILGCDGMSHAAQPQTALAETTMVPLVHPRSQTSQNCDDLPDCTAL
jgi:hypothetical protein